MNKTWLIMKHEFLTTIRRLSYILLTLSFPVLALLGILIYQAVADGGAGVPEEQVIGYVDGTGMFNDYTTSQEGVTFVLYDTNDEARGALLRGDVINYFIIPEDYLESGVIYRFTMQRELEPPEGIIASIEDFLVSNLLSGEVSEEVLERAQTPISPLAVWAIVLDEQGEIVPPQSMAAAVALPLIFAVLFIMSVFFTAGYMAGGVREEKDNRLVEILLSSVSAGQLLSGKIIGLGAAGLLQIVIWLLAAVAILGIFSDIPFLAAITISPELIAFAIIYFILGYLLFAALQAGIGSITRTAGEAGQWSTLITIPAVIPLWISGLFFMDPNHVVFTVLSIFPITAPVTAIMKLAAGEMPTWLLVVSIAVLFASTLAAVWLSARVFRTFVLMYGKRPGLREIWRNVRAG